MPFLNLLDRAELFNANHEIREQLVLALGDLVSLVANIATHFHKAIHGLNGSSVSIDIYRVFSNQIETFRQRCEKVSVSLWGQQLIKENVPPGKGNVVPVPFLLLPSSMLTILIFQWLKSVRSSHGSLLTIPWSPASPTVPLTSPMSVKS